jgi:dihydroorotate dehydrogenase
LVKIAPDLRDAEVRDVAEVVRSERADGVIAVNTSLERPGLRSPRASEAGGLSGAPLKTRAEAVVRILRGALGRGTPIVGVGGIFDGDDAYARIRQGATLVQTYTGFIYGGWNTPRQMGLRLAELLERDGFASVEEAVGADVP